MKRNKPHHPGIIFNGNPVKNSSYLNYLGMFLVSKLDKTNESVGLIRKFQNFLPRPSLLQFYKSLLWPNTDYGDDTYGKAFKGSFQWKHESIQ